MEPFHLTNPCGSPAVRQPEHASGDWRKPFRGHSRDTYKNQPLIIGIMSVVIIGAIISIVMQASSSNSSKAQVYYTNDDGATLFTDSNMLIAPFDKDGKQAVRAHCVHVRRQEGRRLPLPLHGRSPAGLGRGEAGQRRRKRHAEEHRRAA